ncbi:MAG: haloacid dehalogenase-like hydrolase [Clostridia bacterium]|nr:haloacid dehalogenase-like hydrolase [Clostridia bacterium]
MNVYDFDKTISHTDSTAAFVMYCIKRWPKVLLTMPGTGVAALGMVLKVLPKTQFKQYMYRFLKHIPDIDQAVVDFWDSGKVTIHKWYLAQHQEDDLVISASPEFLLRPMCQRLGISRLIASVVDPHTGKYTGVNCHGASKVERYREQYGEIVPEAFYSDSYSDEPMAKISSSAYMVRGEVVEAWNFKDKEAMSCTTM